MNAVIQTEGLTKVYKDFWGRPKHKGLDRLNSSIRPGGAARRIFRRVENFVAPFRARRYNRLRIG